MRSQYAPLVLVLVLAGLLLAAPAALAAPRGKLYVIGMGPAGPATATMQALETLRRMDAVIASHRIRGLFARELRGKSILFDHLKGLWDYRGRFFTGLSPADTVKFKQERVRLTGERVAQIKALLAQGKNLGLLEGGNPMVFSSCHWYTERLDPRDVVFIPGMGSAAAAMAAVGRSVIPAHKTRFLLQSAPFVITDENRPDCRVFKALAPYHPTMVFYMALKNPRPFFAAMAKAFSPQTPCAVVFWAGYPKKQLVVRGTLQDMPGRLARQKEREMGLLLVGRFLRGSPYLAAEDKP